jgi:hypothetical protein
MIWVASALWFSIGLLLSALAWSELARGRERKLCSGFVEREEYLRRIAASEREMLQKQLDTERAMAAQERKELYARIQAYDPNVGDFHPPDYTAPPSRPGEETLGPRSFTEEELAQMKLVEQADGMIRDTRNDALFESVEDWRFWQADLKKRNLPENVHPSSVGELGWEEAVAEAKAQTAAKKAVRTAKN